MKKERKKLAYKLASGAGDGETLQSALTKALGMFPDAPSRVESLGLEGAEVRFINLTRTHQKMLLGGFHKLTKGRAQQVIEMAATKTEWPVTLVNATAPGKPPREFVEGTLYFGIWKDHVIMHQSSGCRANQLQGYLSWLLSRPAPGSPPDAATEVRLVSLADPMPPELRKKSGLPVKKITFGSSLQTASAGPPRSNQAAGENQSATRTKFHFAPSGGVWDAVKSILRDINADVPEDLLLDNPLDKEDIRVALELSCSKKKSKSTAGEVLGALGHSLSHTDACNFTVELADGTRIKSKQMKVESHFGVECVEGQPVLESLFSSMVDYLRQLVECQTVIEQEPFGNTK